MSATIGDQAVKRALERARHHAPFLKLQLERCDLVRSALDTGNLGQAIEIAVKCAEGTADVGTALRRERAALALALGIGDLAGALPLERVVESLSDFADRALEAALAAVISGRTPGAEPRGFVVIALGKHGSRELNYSSDIDVLFLYDPATLPRRAREEAGQAAVRVAQQVTELLQKRDGEGYVFRVDLRLRPSPEVTPIALPADAAISHYESSALPWERAAFIRARVAAGDQELGRYFLDAIHPFVWRRSLDFGAIAELQSVTGRIRDHYAEGQGFGPGYDVKRGRGGIREIEFYAQMHQLIHGGREPALREPATLPALTALAEAGRIPREEADDLAAAYRLLRTIEHRLQMVDDRQTHSLPEDGQALDNVARLHGLETGEELLSVLRPHVERVAAIYTGLGPETQTSLPLARDRLEVRLAGAGLTDPGAAASRIEAWRSGKPRSLRTAAAREAFEAMLPGLVEAFGAAPDGMRAINRFDDLVMRLPSGVNFFRLLEARPEIGKVLATLLCHAPALADQLGRRPELIEGLIDSSAFTPPPAVEELVADFSRAERVDEDYELVLDRVRRRVNERRFALGAQLVLARTDPLDVAEGYSRVAEAAVNVLTAAAAAEFESAHGRVPGSELLILGLGRLGGEALTYASDLDLVYLFSGTHETASDGAKPLRATDYFNRLAPRVTAALSVATAAGPLYDIDTRLRPSGKDGLLAISLPSFSDYQQHQAWTWEHMALTRARPVYGSEGGRAALAHVVRDALAKPRDPAKVTADAVAMRRDMARHKPASGPFDIKLGDGGLVDLEFAVHTLQLRHGIALHPRLEDALADLVGAGLVSPEIDPALRLLTRMLVTFRLVLPSSGEPPPASRPLVARACGLPDWDSLLAAHREARQRVADLWGAVARAGGD
ncbi:MAG TPA: bifunctional [glutamate--ammonia ligase]-adenylyl-L-tyrosine phosphorylase/[glutamate--ammonia-ligase] adenylyltransferase [Allosphingosinicella sp.]|jgi:glutamate-ammonia-ligase adenylyltransferase|uniref:bifunctional [glutamate--ammonia ligase]-adenylyl-L-tyrosine phosphorylase/[glutamate--ammonia-ligase] adenylyltransferase n=1 Tax=Allosphingosinicella sp. TaxID=2823234 RepID=UPI002F29B125